MEERDDRIDLWGSNTAYQTQIFPGAEGEAFDKVAASGLYTLLLQQDGLLASWGNGEAILVPNSIDPSLPPEPAGPRYHYFDSKATLGGIAAISGGVDHLLVLTSAQQVVKFNWPSGDPMQVEDWTMIDDVPSDLKAVDEIAASNGFSMVLGVVQ